ncbi:hypothetical protein ACEWQ7_004623 [Salmonella enterica]|nr:hypothetical protein [Salmonella enterica subsp. enterica serovar Abaetetuba]
MANKIVNADLVLDVFKKHGAYITLCDVNETVKFCNKNSGEMQYGLDPEGWAHRLAKEEAYQQECEAQEAACDYVHFDQGNQERTAEIYLVPGSGGNE